MAGAHAHAQKRAGTAPISFLDRADPERNAAQAPIAPTLTHPQFHLLPRIRKPGRKGIKCQSAQGNDLRGRNPTLLK